MKSPVWCSGNCKRIINLADNEQESVDNAWTARETGRVCELLPVSKTTNETANATVNATVNAAVKLNKTQLAIIQAIKNDNSANHNKPRHTLDIDCALCCFDKNIWRKC